MAILVAACGSGSPEPKGEAIECAVGPGAEFAAVCTLEAVSGSEFVIHHPDGGFRRFVIDEQGEIALADSAEDLAISMTPCDDRQLVEFETVGARYRMPESDIPRAPDE